MYTIRGRSVNINPGHSHGETYSYSPLLSSRCWPLQHILWCSSNSMLSSLLTTSIAMLPGRYGTHIIDIPSIHLIVSLRVRFLGYAGVPLLLAVPSLLFSVSSMIQVLKMSGRQSLRNLTGLTPSHTPLTDYPQRASIRRKPVPVMGRVLPTPSPTQPMSPPGRAPISPGFASPVLSARQFHLPFSQMQAHMRTVSSLGSTAPDLDFDEPESPVSSNFPTFGRGSRTDSHRMQTADRSTPQSGRQPIAVYQYPPSDTTHEDMADWREHESPSRLTKGSVDDLSALRWNRDFADDHGNVHVGDGASKSDFQYEWKRQDGEYVDDGFVVVEDHHYRRGGVSPNYQQTLPRPLSRESVTSSLLAILSSLSRCLFTFASTRPYPGSFENLLVANVCFSVRSHRSTLMKCRTFTLGLLLASISTIIDVVRGRTIPTPFGTQHVALLLVAWGPVIVFGMSNMSAVTLAHVYL